MTDKLVGALRAMLSVKSNNGFTQREAEAMAEQALSEYEAEQALDSKMKIEYGNKVWRNAKGKLHRLDGPAVERADGYKAWWVNGELHRLDGPAVERADGYKAWYVDGKLHRLDGPAVEEADGDKAWYVNDNLHRLDGPAVEEADGDKAWYVDGKKLTESEFKKRTQK